MCSRLGQSPSSERRAARFRPSRSAKSIDSHPGHRRHLCTPQCARRESAAHHANDACSASRTRKALSCRVSKQGAVEAEARASARTWQSQALATRQEAHDILAQDRYQQREHHQPRRASLRPRAVHRWSGLSLMWGSSSSDHTVSICELSPAGAWFLFWIASREAGLLCVLGGRLGCAWEGETQLRL